jgi:hypothetical protein
MRTIIMLLALALGTIALADGPGVVIINGRSMAPLRFVSETFGASVSYNSATKGITFSLDYQKVDMSVGSATAKVGGKPVILDTAPVIIAGVTYVPVRFIAIACGAQAVWVTETRQVKIIHPGSGKKVMLFVKQGPGKPAKTTIYRDTKHGRRAHDTEKHDDNGHHGRGHH